MTEPTKHQQVSWRIDEHKHLFQSSLEKIYEDLISVLDHTLAGMSNDPYFYPITTAYQRLYEQRVLVESLSKYWSSEQNQEIDIKMRRLAVLVKELCVRYRGQ